jgi:chemotaxis protein MotB
MTGSSRRQAEADEPQGAPEWMVTFSDCMTLLLTFFVLLLSFSSFDENIIWKLKIIFSEALPAVSSEGKETGGAFLPTMRIQSTKKPDEGSEKPTLTKGSEDRLREDTEPMDFLSRKVFLIPSDRIFWGKSTAISSEGGNIITTIGSYLKEVPNKVVISESGPAADDASNNLGLSRAWAVIKYLTTRHNVEKKRLSISAEATTIEENVENAEAHHIKQGAKRMLEVTLLERSICN